jgi:diguanylate cyclase (GGDEF)-like protein
VLSGVGPRDRVAIVLSGGSGPIRIVRDVGAVEDTLALGFGTGFYDAVLLTVLAFGIVAIFAFRDATMLWYLGYVASLIVAETAHDDLFGLGPHVAKIVLSAAGVPATICLVGFVTSYLQLYRRARALFWFTLGGSAVPALGAALTIARFRSDDDLVIVVPNLIGILIISAVAAARRRSGFTPALYLLAGSAAVGAAYAGKIARDAFGVVAPFHDRWDFEIGIVFALALYSLGIADRGRFIAREHDGLRTRLEEANYAAMHDPLTGLLNRRGLEAWVEGEQALQGKLLFIDLDGFKNVNDRGGHAAGDRALQVVARIICHAVRDSDVVARFGGDEFVIVLTDCRSDRLVAEVAERIAEAVEAMRPLGSQNDTRIGASIGSGTLNRSRGFARALHEADTNTYRVKTQRRAEAAGAAPAASS